MIGLFIVSLCVCLFLAESQVRWIQQENGEMINEFGSYCRPLPDFIQISPLRDSKLSFYIGNASNVRVRGVYDSGAETTMLSVVTARMNSDQLRCHRLILVGANFVAGGAHLFKCIAEIVIADQQGQSSAVVTVLVPSRRFSGSHGMDLFGFNAMETTYSDMSHTCSTLSFRKGRFVDKRAMAIFDDALLTLNLTAADLVPYSQLPLDIADSSAELASKGLTHTISYVDAKSLGMAQFLLKR